VRGLPTVWQNGANESAAVSAQEISRLRKRFMKLDRDGSGSIDKDEFLQIPQCVLAAPPTNWS
jgi:Ca2+-binding EF-hand superfamily protein